MTDTTRSTPVDRAKSHSPEGRSPTGTMSLIVNGDEREFHRGLTVTGLLEALELVPGTVVVERNREIVSRDDYPCVTLEEDDRIELVHFVGGG